MKKLLLILIGLIFTISIYSQETSKRDIVIQKTTPMLHLNGLGGYINFYNGDVTLVQASNELNVNGGRLDANGGLAVGEDVTKAIISEINILNGKFYILNSTGDTLDIHTTVASQVELSDYSVMLTDSTGGAAGNYMPRLQTANLVTDTITARIANATVGLAAADTNTYGGATTRTFVESLLGSGSGLSAQRLPFIIGTTTGAPTTSDSTVVHTAFNGKHIDVYRDGAKQYQNFTATNTVDGFRVSGSTITVNPLWQDGEQVLVDIIQPILWSYLSLTGQESSLLDSLRGYWKLDETSGTTVVDATGTQNAYRMGSVGFAAGKLGYASTFNIGSDVVEAIYNTNTVPKGVDFSFAAWIRLDSLPSVVGHDCYVFQQNLASSPWWAHRIYVSSSDNKIVVGSRNTSGTAYNVYSAAALEVGTWYHVVFVNRGNGQTLRLYMNGTDVSTTAGTFSGTLLEGLSHTCFGNAYSNAGENFEGTIDSPGIWGVALTSGQVTTLYNSGNGRTHPFN